MTATFSFSGFDAHLRGFIDGYSRPEICFDDRSDPAENEFNKLALTLFALQFTHNAPYRQFCQARGADPESIRQWSSIPAMPAAAFKELDLTSLPAEQRTKVFHSSGTTGQKPSRHFHDANSLKLYENSLLSWFQTHLLTIVHKNVPDPQHLSRNRPDAPASEMTCVSLTPSSASAPNSSLAHMFETIHRQIDWHKSIFTGHIEDDGVWIQDLDKTLDALGEAVAANHPVMILGTAFNFVHLLDHLAHINRRIPLPAGSRVMETGGYKGRSRIVPKSQLHALISDWLSVPVSHIVCEYGMSELCSQAYDGVVGDSRERGHIFRFPPWVHAQIISPETGMEVLDGGTGLIRIFDLANVCSVMAVQTEDLGILRRGDGFELIGRAAQAEPRGCSLMAT